MIDVHVLLVPNDPVELFNRCLESLKDEPITLHIIDGIVGNIGQSRVKGFKAGKADYVGWVDPDDYISPGAFRECLEFLQDNPEAAGVYMYEATVSNGVVLDQISRYPHHMTVVKRTLVESLYSEIAKIPTNAESVINKIKTLHCIPKVGYYYCIRPDSFSRAGPKDT